MGISCSLPISLRGWGDMSLTFNYMKVTDANSHLGWGISLSVNDREALIDVGSCGLELTTEMRTDCGLTTHGCKSGSQGWS